RDKAGTASSDRRRGAASSCRRIGRPNRPNAEAGCECGRRWPHSWGRSSHGTNKGATIACLRWRKRIEDQGMDFGIVTAKVDEIGFITHAENLGYNHCWVT